MQRRMPSRFACTVAVMHIQTESTCAFMILVRAARRSLLPSRNNRPSALSRLGISAQLGFARVPTMPQGPVVDQRIVRVHQLRRALLQAPRFFPGHRVRDLQCDSRCPLRIKCHDHIAQHDGWLLAPLDGNEPDVPLQVGRELEPVRWWR